MQDENTEVINEEEVVATEDVVEAESDESSQDYEKQDKQDEQNEQEQGANWLKELRKSYREEKKRNRELEERIKALEPANKTPTSPGKEPELEDYDYDTEKFKSAWKTWNERRAEVEAAERRAKAEEEAKANEWKSTLENYDKQKKLAQAEDIEDAEEVVRSLMNNTQQGIILHAAEIPVNVILELGRNERKAIELASITDPIKFAAAIAKMEATMKPATQRKAPAPESRPPATGAARSTAISGNADKLLEDAIKTGDMSKYRAFMRQQREKSA